MEMPAKATVLNLIAICFALVLLIAIFVDFTRPQLSRLEPVPGESPALEANWFSARTFNLLSGELPPPAGVDAKGMAERNPFARTPVPDASAASEQPVVEPEPEPPLPPPPATREISLVYRGFYRSSSGAPFVYVEVEKETRVYPIDGQIAPGWTIGQANANELILMQDGEVRRQFPFNQKKSLEVPLKSQP